MEQLNDNKMRNPIAFLKQFLSNMCLLQDQSILFAWFNFISRKDQAIILLYDAIQAGKIMIFFSKYKTDVMK